MKQLMLFSFFISLLLPMSTSFAAVRRIHRTEQCLFQNKEGDFSANQPAAPRRKKVNKYAKFSKDGVDPLEAAMTKAVEEAKMVAIGDAPVRGTTVPNIDWDAKSVEATSEPRGNKTNVLPEKGIDSIIPSDPFTFGYTKIGDTQQLVLSSKPKHFPMRVTKQVTLQVLMASKAN